eukprot:7376658-Prymnesium_polylepis.2
MIDGDSFGRARGRCLSACTALVCGAPCSRAGGGCGDSMLRGVAQSEWGGERDLECSCQHAVESVVHVRLRSCTMEA